jgi:hypothetical protein
MIEFVKEYRTLWKGLKPGSKVQKELVLIN